MVPTVTDSLSAEMGGGEAKVGDAVADAIESLDRGCQRRFQIMIGALVGDASSVGAMWNYDPTKITDHIKEHGLSKPEFCNPPCCTYFTVPEGSYSCHGDQVLAIMEAIVESGSVDTESIAKKMDATFGLTSSYGEIETLSGQTRGWRNACVKTFIEASGKPTAERAHATDCQSDAYVRVIPIVALYAGRPELMPMCEKVIRLMQDNDKAVVLGLAAARILEGCILGKPADIAVFEAAAGIPTTVGELRSEFATILGDMYELRHEKDGEKVVSHIGSALEQEKKGFARSCMPPYCLQLPTQAIASVPESYSKAVRAAIYQGGDCCSRAVLVGAAAGACMVGGGIGGDEGIPLAWLGRISRGKRVLELAAAISSLAAKLPAPELPSAAKM